MKKIQWKSPKGIALIALIAVVAAAAIAVPVWLLLNREPEIIKVPTDEEYVYVNPDETKAVTDTAFWTKRSTKARNGCTFPMTTAATM